MSTNVDRAGWAHEAVQKFAEVTGLTASNDTLDTKVGDLLSDLMHLTLIEGLDFDEILERARGYFQEELSMERDTPRVTRRKDWDPRRG